MSTHRIIAIALLFLTVSRVAAAARIQPPERIRDLASYGERQSEMGGGFYGMMPEQLADPDSIPLPIGTKGELAAALCLARHRAENLAALERINWNVRTRLEG